MGRPVGLLRQRRFLEVYHEVMVKVAMGRGRKLVTARSGNVRCAYSEDAVLGSGGGGCGSGGLASTTHGCEGGGGCGWHDDVDVAPSGSMAQEATVAEAAAGAAAAAAIAAAASADDEDDPEDFVAKPHRTSHLACVPQIDLNILNDPMGYEDMVRRASLSARDERERCNLPEAFNSARSAGSPDPRSSVAAVAPGTGPRSSRGTRSSHGTMHTKGEMPRLKTTQRRHENSVAVSVIGGVGGPTATTSRGGVADPACRRVAASSRVGGNASERSSSGVRQGKAKLAQLDHGVASTTGGEAAAPQSISSAAVSSGASGLPASVRRATCDTESHGLSGLGSSSARRGRRLVRPAGRCETKSHAIVGCNTATSGSLANTSGLVVSGPVLPPFDEESNSPTTTIARRRRRDQAMKTLNKTANIYGVPQRASRRSDPRQLRCEEVAPESLFDDEVGGPPLQRSSLPPPQRPRVHEAEETSADTVARQSRRYPSSGSPRKGRPRVERDLLRNSRSPERTDEAGEFPTAQFRGSSGCGGGCNGTPVAASVQVGVDNALPAAGGDGWSTFGATVRHMDGPPSFWGRHGGLGARRAASPGIFLASVNATGACASGGSTSSTMVAPSLANTGVGEFRLPPPQVSPFRANGGVDGETCGSFHGRVVAGSRASSLAAAATAASAVAAAAAKILDSDIAGAGIVGGDLFDRAESGCGDLSVKSPLNSALRGRDAVSSIAVKADVEEELVRVESLSPPRRWRRPQPFLNLEKVFQNMEQASSGQPFVYSGPSSAPSATEEKQRRCDLFAPSLDTPPYTDRPSRPPQMCPRVAPPIVESPMEVLHRPFTPPVVSVGKLLREFCKPSAFNAGSAVDDPKAVGSITAAFGGGACGTVAPQPPPPPLPFSSEDGMAVGEVDVDFSESDVGLSRSVGHGASNSHKATELGSQMSRCSTENAALDRAAGGTDDSFVEVVYDPEFNMYYDPVQDKYYERMSVVDPPPAVAS
eukprot:TRINITY_DN74148_c0_g1_i1.p1 TRINITY_DN74148_c0_g1~~TRINITY_DN74148_c0_g1_i1.p1  ORF type:complete len:990 (-),score=176.20 TRINITY_DN74148_c0_g1_i1:66-3035(-)